MFIFCMLGEVNGMKKYHVDKACQRDIILSKINKINEVNYTTCSQKMKYANKH